MTSEFFRAITPFITLGVMFVLGLVGWILKRSLEVTDNRLRELKSDLRLRMDRIDAALEKLESSRLEDQRNLHERFVSREWFSAFTGNSEMTLARVERQLQTLNRKFNGLLVRYKKTG